MYTQTVWGWRVSHLVLSFLLLFMLMRVLRGEGALTDTLVRLKPTALVPGTATIFPCSLEKESRKPWAALLEGCSAALRACQ